MTMANRKVYIRPANAGLPTRSWWLDVRTRDEFSQRARAERERMQQSAFGQTARVGLATAKDSEGQVKGI